MVSKQISLTMPEKLFKASKKYINQYGYKNLQEFILDLLRRRVMIERYMKIENEMKAGKARRFNQKEAVEYLKNL